MSSTPVFFITAAVLLGVFFLVQPRIDDAPCDDSVGHAAVRPWLHGNWSHLLANLVAFWALVEVEKRIGSRSFALLLGFLLLAVVLMDFIVPRSIDKCSIGFSGVVLGLLVWDAFAQGSLSFEWAAMLSLLWIWLGPIISGGGRVSLWGHLYGILAGMLAAFLSSRFLKPTAAPAVSAVGAVKTPSGATLIATK